MNINLSIECNCDCKSKDEAKSFVEKGEAIKAVYDYRNDSLSFWFEGKKYALLRENFKLAKDAER